MYVYVSICGEGCVERGVCVCERESVCVYMHLYVERGVCERERVYVCMYLYVERGVCSGVCVCVRERDTVEREHEENGLLFFSFIVFLLSLKTRVIFEKCVYKHRGQKFSPLSGTMKEHTHSPLPFAKTCSESH